MSTTLTELSPRSRRLLLFFLQLHGVKPEDGIYARLWAAPEDTGFSMATFEGLKRQGLVREDADEQWHLTPEGLRVAREVREDASRHWTHVAPTKPGYYWWRETMNDRPEIVETFPDPLTDEICWYAGGFEERVEPVMTRGGLWHREPIRMPE